MIRPNNEEFIDLNKTEKIFDNIDDKAYMDYLSSAKNISPRTFSIIEDEYYTKENLNYIKTPLEIETMLKKSKDQIKRKRILNNKDLYDSNVIEDGIISKSIVTSIVFDDINEPLNTQEKFEGYQEGKSGGGGAERSFDSPSNDSNESSNDFDSSSDCSDSSCDSSSDY